MATIDVLGEFIRAPEEAEATATEYERVLDAIAAERLDANVSVKLSALGAEIDPALADGTLARVVRCAERHGIFVRIDMEHSGLTDRTLRVYRGLREAGHDGIGIVLQAYLRRTMDDVHAVADLAPSVRVVKGIYVEPAEIAYKDPAAINGNFVRIVDRLLVGGKLRRDRDARPRPDRGGARAARPPPRLAGGYEFQMLLGVTEDIRHRLVGGGAPHARLRPVRQCVVRLLRPQAEGEPVDRRLRRPRRGASFVPGLR